MIFLDTNTYISKNFQFNTYDLGKLNGYIYSEDMHLLITDVNVREVKKHISIKSKEAFSVLKKAKRDAMILRNVMDLPCAGLFENVSANDILSRINSQFDEFVDGGNVEIVNVATANIKEIFDDYFSEEPPFDLANKKSEFPDAFVLSAINKISRERGHKLYVVSNDGDFKRYCAKHENLISLSTIDELIDLIVRNSEKLAVPAKFADEMYDRLKVDIHETLLEKLQTSELDPPLDFDEEFELEDIEIEEFEIVSKNILEVSREHAIYELKINLSVVATFSVVDYERSPWDPEDKVYMFYLTNEYVKVYSYSPKVILHIVYDDGIVDNARIESFDIDDVLDFNNAKSEVLSFKARDYVDDDWGDEAEAVEAVEAVDGAEAGAAVAAEAVVAGEVKAVPLA